MKDVSFAFEIVIPRRRTIIILGKNILNRMWKNLTVFIYFMNVAVFLNYYYNY